MGASFRARRVFKKMVQKEIRMSEKVKVDKLIAEGEEEGKEWVNVQKRAHMDFRGFNDLGT